MDDHETTSLTDNNYIVDNKIKKNKLLPPPQGKIYFGAFPDFGGYENNVSSQKIVSFEAISGKKMAWAYFSQNWFDGITYPKLEVHVIQESGSVPFVRLMPRTNSIQGYAEEYFTLQNIIDGKFDKELRQWARDAKQDNIPMLAEFAPEMNGNWFQWSGIFHGGAKTDGYGDVSYPDGPERYRDAYRHIIDIFREENVHHITWFFHADHGTYPNEAWNKPKKYYPGDDYIDWIGFTIYGAQQVTWAWEGYAFSTQLEMHYSDIAEISDTKPIALLEFGVTDNHPDGNKSKWLDDAYRTILDNPYMKISAISPWHENWKNEDGTFSKIRVDSSLEAKETFRKWIANERFTSTLRFK
ncbi:MAG: glycoside hydrolase family 26 protein [Sulfurovum sp.]|nr:glycoside hydrolase family 26 protein [Sulfurovum sp.]